MHTRSFQFSNRMPTLVQVSTPARRSPRKVVQDDADQSVVGDVLEVTPERELEVLKLEMSRMINNSCLPLPVHQYMVWRFSNIGQRISYWDKMMAATHFFAWCFGLSVTVLLSNFKIRERDWEMAKDHHKECDRYWKKHIDPALYSAGAKSEGKGMSAFKTMRGHFYQAGKVVGTIVEANPPEHLSTWELISEQMANQKSKNAVLKKMQWLIDDNNLDASVPDLSDVEAEEQEEGSKEGSQGEVKGKGTTKGKGRRKRNFVTPPKKSPTKKKTPSKKKVSTPKKTKRIVTPQKSPVPPPTDKKVIHVGHRTMAALMQLMFVLQMKGHFAPRYLWSTSTISSLPEGVVPSGNEESTQQFDQRPWLILVGLIISGNTE